jgi:hypothetical protein
VDHRENWTRPTRVIRTDSARNINIVLLPMLRLSTALIVPRTPRPTASQSLHVAVTAFTILDLISTRAPCFSLCEATVTLNFRDHGSSGNRDQSRTDSQFPGWGHRIHLGLSALNHACRHKNSRLCLRLSWEKSGRWLHGQAAQTKCAVADP